MSKYKNMPIEVVREKYALAQLNKGAIMDDLIWGFVGMFVLFLFVFNSYAEKWFFVALIALFAALLFCGTVHAFKKLSFIGGGLIALFIKFFLAMCLGMFITPFDLIKTITELNELKQIVEEDRRVNPEFYSQTTNKETEKGDN